MAMKDGDGLWPSRNQGELNPGREVPGVKTQPFFFSFFFIMLVLNSVSDNSSSIEIDIE